MDDLYWKILLKMDDNWWYIGYFRTPKRVFSGLGEHEALIHWNMGYPIFRQAHMGQQFKPMCRTTYNLVYVSCELTIFFEVSN